MKYIRTKDGRVIDNEIMCIGFAKDNILKQANTIEELCDCWIVIDKKDRHFYYEIYETAKKYKRSSEILFGAIWTEWGLKYVSKMNESGELELL